MSKTSKIVIPLLSLVAFAGAVFLAVGKNARQAYFHHERSMQSQENVLPNNQEGMISSVIMERLSGAQRASWGC